MLFEINIARWKSGIFEFLGRKVTCISQPHSVTRVEITAVAFPPNKRLCACVKTYLGLEGVVLLAEVLLPEVVWVSPLVAPLEDLGPGHVDVLELSVLVVPAVSVGFGQVTQLGHGEGGRNGAADKGENLKKGEKWWTKCSILWIWTFYAVVIIFNLSLKTLVDRKAAKLWENADVSMASLSLLILVSFRQVNANLFQDRIPESQFLFFAITAWILQSHPRYQPAVHGALALSEACFLKKHFLPLRSSEPNIENKIKIRIP